MRRTHWLFGTVALAAAFGLLAVVATGGSSRAEDKAKGDDDPALNEGGQAAKDVATAYELIEYGRRNKTKALCVGVEMLMDAKGPAEKLEAEGGEEVKPGKKADELQKILDEAKEFPTATNATNKKLITETADKVKGLASRGTARGYTSTTVNVPYTNPSTDKPVVTISKTFLGGRKAIVTTTSVAPTAGSPVDVRVLDSAGNEIQHDSGTHSRMEWIVKKDATFKIVLRNKHKAVKAVTVKVETN